MQWSSSTQTLFSTVIWAESYFITSCTRQTIFPACSINLFSWISAYRCWRVPIWRNHLHTYIATGRGFVFRRYWCRNTSKTKHMALVPKKNKQPTVTSPWSSKFCLLEGDWVQIVVRQPAVPSVRVCRWESSSVVTQTSFRRIWNVYN